MECSFNSQYRAYQAEEERYEKIMAGWRPAKHEVEERMMKIATDDAVLDYATDATGYDHLNRAVRAWHTYGNDADRRAVAQEFFAGLVQVLLQNDGLRQNALDSLERDEYDCRRSAA